MGGKRSHAAPDALMTSIEAAAFLKVHPTTLRRLAAQGRVPAFKVGKDWRYHRLELEAHVIAQRNTATMRALRVINPGQTWDGIPFSQVRLVRKDGNIEDIK